MSQQRNATEIAITNKHHIGYRTWSKPLALFASDAMYFMSVNSKTRCVPSKNDTQYEIRSSPTLKLKFCD